MTCTRGMLPRYERAAAGGDMGANYNLVAFFSW